jgi:transketolase
LGDQAGEEIGGVLYFVPYEQYVRVLCAPISLVDKACIFAALCRINTLYMIACAGSGHIGSSFSSLDIMSWLMLNEIQAISKNNTPLEQNIFFSSKGHDAPGLYSTLLGVGVLNFDLIHKLRKLGGLPGHPDIGTPNIAANTGSLGMGVSKAKGMIFANRLLGRKGFIFVLTGDGELQEGQFWESLISAANHNLHELIVIIDHNKLQSDTLVSKVSDLGDLSAKLSAFGWDVTRCDGNNLTEFSQTLTLAKRSSNKPKIIIADTVKGKGVSFMEHTSIDSDIENYKFHSGAPTAAAYAKAIKELAVKANTQLGELGFESLILESIVRPNALLQNNPQRLINAYSLALIEQATKNNKIVALDADLILDTGLIAFQNKFPQRFLECGIAEQDMVSQAGGMALQGLLPIVHSFSCFLSTRPNEQIYNNSTEHTKVIYVGSLAGLLPAGPGHSHQCVRDISTLGAIPGLVAMEPCCELEVGQLLDWCINKSEESAYLRLTSVPWEVPFNLPVEYVPTLGKGVTLLDGKDAAIIAYGPVMLSEAFLAAQRAKSECNLNVKIINLPWLNYVDEDWLLNEFEQTKVIISLESHYQIGGQGDRLGSILAQNIRGYERFYRLGVDRIPVCGTSEEALRAHRLDRQSIYEYLVATLGK